MKRITIFSIIVILCMITQNINAQWSGKNPIWTNDKVGIGTNFATGQLHILTISPSSYTPTTTNQPNITLTNICDDGKFQEPPFIGAKKSEFNIETDCWSDKFSINQDDGQGNKNEIVNMNQNSVYFQPDNFNVSNKIIINSSETNINIPLIVNGSNTINGNNTLNGANIVNGVTNLNGATTVTGELKIKGHNNLVIQHGDFYITNGSSNQFKVSSDGIVRAREVKVDLAIIPDYVFKDGYKLMPIAELEKFVTLNKHLPNVKGENEYNKEEGIDIGEMNLKLLEKVEELTLYTIQQQKEIDELKNQINLLLK